MQSPWELLYQAARPTQRSKQKKLSEGRRDKNDLNKTHSLPREKFRKLKLFEMSLKKPQSRNNQPTRKPQRTCGWINGNCPPEPSQRSSHSRCPTKQNTQTTVWAHFPSLQNYAGSAPARAELGLSWGRAAKRFPWVRTRQSCSEAPHRSGASLCPAGAPPRGAARSSRHVANPAKAGSFRLLGLILSKSDLGTYPGD